LNLKKIYDVVVVVVAAAAAVVVGLRNRLENS